MGLFNKIQFFIYELKDKRRYKKFKNCSIPYPFYDKKRNVFEWIRYSNVINQYETTNNLIDALGSIGNIEMIYHYKANFYNYEKNKYENIISHCHSFDELINELYRYPESFEIPSEYLNEYSNQELNYIKSIKKYFKLINLKDEKYSKELEELDNKWESLRDKKHKSLKEIIFLHNTYSKEWDKLSEKEKLERCNNKKALEFYNYHQIWAKTDKVANAIINGEKDYKIYIKHPFSSSKLNEKFLVVNTNYEYLGIVKVIKEDIIKFKDLKENMVDYKLAGFKNFNEYKDSMFKDFKEECEAYDEKFTKESLISYVKLEIVEKFDT